MTAHPNVTIVDASLTKEDIERFYSKKHAGVWELIRTLGLAAAMPPPIFEVVSLSARCDEHTAQARGKREIEPGWVSLHPEDESALSRELPEEPNLLEALARGALTIEGADVIETRGERAMPLGVAELIRVMKDEKIGRPSTYASHVEAMFECVDLGWLSLDADGRFRMTEAGHRLLRVLADPALPALDKSYTTELEADLDAIEQGKKSPAQVLRRHLGRLPGVRVNIPADALEHISGAAESEAAVSEPLEAGTPIHTTVALPQEIDPELVLAPGHPLRALRAALDDVILAALGRARPNRAEASRRKACRAVALGEVMGVVGAQLLERLSLDLGWRWVVGLAPSDRVWTMQVMATLVSNESELVKRLVDSAASSIASSADHHASRSPCL